ncbi:NAD-dependent epimerase/dehydratase family protein [Halioxenophilus sp. WMMB6]|uniref:NAD-dependent epimerase/dehydratase family protein n=1 Tax=Halioxenophilus sp. WMMB6 TaxID=3073815 RepID=UPI00295E8713|nr:NAD-dependent epimerase/dehydratase family protein [Halioxenophilus sp. WMMB6]
MRVLIIGASGFIGRLLAESLIKDMTLNGKPVEQLLLLDRSLPDFPASKAIKCYSGDYSEPTLLRRILADAIDVVFHLASMPGVMAEQDYELGYRVNLQASLELLAQLRSKANCPTLIYASSIAVYGNNLPAGMDEGYVPRPVLSYGVHKLIIEQQLNDLTRRGEINGHALRLPVVVARSEQSEGLESAFMSDILRSLATGKHYRCPVSAQATAWWMSSPCCVENLKHAASLDAATSQSIWQLPVLRQSVAEVVSVASELYQQDASLVTYAPEPNLEAQFGRFPAINTQAAQQAGFRHDGDLHKLISNALLTERENGCV